MPGKPPMTPGLSPVYESGFNRGIEMPFVARKSLLVSVVVLAAAVAVYMGFLWSGLYNVGADDPHWKPTMMMMQTLRARSIHVRSQDLTAPDLNDPDLILKGAGQYAAMCTGCHLAPGMPDSELRQGLYPQPPNFSLQRLDAKDEFWVIKHGIKMSAMPAWGLSHDDPTIWSMVAFLQKLPGMTPAQYKDIVARAPADEDMQEMVMPGMKSEAHSHAHAAVEAPAAGEAGAAEDAVSFEGFTAKAAPDAEAAAAAFHTALQTGDRTSVLAMLAPQVTISEGGQTQSRDQYAALHLAEDIALLKSARVKPVLTVSMPMGATAMVGSRSEIHTAHDGQPIAIASTEILTMKKTPSGWVITQIHWASQPLAN